MITWALKLTRLAQRTLKISRYGIIRFMRNESGQGTTEYVLLLSAVVFFASAFMNKIIGTFDKVATTIGAELERNLKTGRLDPRAWKN